MKNDKRFEMLVARARGERPARVDVAGQVLAILAAGQGQPMSISDRPLIWLAAASLAVAVPVAVFAIVVYGLWADPLTEIFEAISWVI